MIDRKRGADKGKNSDLCRKASEKEYLTFLFRSLYERLQSHYDVSALDLLGKNEKGLLIPVSVFNERLSVFESVCKYLKEDCGLKNKAISELLGKGAKSIWQAYDNASNKSPSRLIVDEKKGLIPVVVLKKKKSLLTSLVVYFKEELNLSYHDIALLLKRDDRTIWTVYNRSKKKGGK